MKKILWFGLFVVLLFAADFYYFQHVPLVVVRLNVVVRSGDSLNLILEKVPQLAGGRYRIYFALYGKLFAPVMKPGNHVVEAGASLLDVFQSVGRDPEDIKVTLLEGDRLEQFADKLASNQVADKQALLACFKGCPITGFTDWLDAKSGYEGFLFPDTYNFQVASDPRLVVVKFLQNFKTKLPALSASTNSISREYSLRQKVIVASLLEREGITLADKRMIAGIIYRRLNQGMRLDIDATLLYVLGDWHADITYQDLQSSSPYNTRKQLGLPPGPICNPGLASLQAAFNPTASKYLYYLTGTNGQMYYAETLEQHNLNKSRYL